MRWAPFPPETTSREPGSSPERKVSLPDGLRAGEDAGNVGWVVERGECGCSFKGWGEGEGRDKLGGGWGEERYGIGF